MGQMRFEQLVLASQETVWSLLTVPERMNLWSEAKIVLLRAGQPGRPDSVGTCREVHVPAGPFCMKLVERVVAADRPREFRYQVVSGGMLREHRGHIVLEPGVEGERCTVRWTVQFKPLVPFTGPLARAIVEPALRRSLRRLAQLAEAS